MKIYDIHNRDEALLSSLLDVWERSVRATHTFLTEAEIQNIKKYVPHALAAVEHLTIALDEADALLAFMGVTAQRLVVLFVAPNARGTGIGKRLLSHGIQRYGVCEVTVNEQNPQAIGFYTHLGFAPYKRTDLDEQGNPYPLLYMKRTPTQ